MKNVYLYDTTLRDGTQSEEVSLSVLDKVAIAEKLDEFGIHYIEGGYPGSNPKDKEFFERARKMRWKNSVMCAFGMTRRVGKKVDEDANMKALVAAGTPVITVVGKSWDFHVIEALRTTLEENLYAVKDTVVYLKKNADKVFFDAEHFFDGYHHNPKYAMKVLAAAVDAGADVLILCDTNGGSLPSDITRIVKEVRKEGILLAAADRSFADGPPEPNNFNVTAESGSNVALSTPTVLAFVAGCHHEATDEPKFSIVVI